MWRLRRNEEAKFLFMKPGRLRRNGKLFTVRCKVVKATSEGRAAQNGSGAARLCLGIRLSQVHLQISQFNPAELEFQEIDEIFMRIETNYP